LFTQVRRLRSEYGGPSLRSGVRLWERTSPHGTGVFGEGGQGNPGVHGRGAPGVKGEGWGGRGGEFSSDAMAPLRVFPYFQRAPIKENFPKEAEIGDLVVMTPGNKDSREGDSTLWLCVVRSLDQNNPARWRQVELGPTI